MLRKLAVAAALAIGCAAQMADTANAANCAALEMRVMQLQARSNPDQGALAEARNMLGMCNGTQTASALPWGNKPKTEGQQVRTQGRATPNTVRTLCVRACDGYYFPISFSTSKKYLEVDEATCQRLCPAGDAALYFHSRRAGPETMVSIDGSSYTDLPNAFRYRKVLDRSCTCGTPLPISEPDADVLLATYSDEPGASAPTDPAQATGDDLGDLIQTSSVASLPAGELRRATDMPRVILATGSVVQDQLLASEVPGKWFQPEPDLLYLRGPGDMACLRRGPACQVQ